MTNPFRSPPARGATTSGDGMYGPPTPLWVRIVLIVNALLIGLAALLLGSSRDLGGLIWPNRIFALLFLVPFAGVAVLLGKRPRPFAYGAVCGTTIAFVGVSSLALVAWGGDPVSNASIAKFDKVVLAYVAVQIAVLLWTIWTVRGMGLSVRSGEAWWGLAAVYVWPMVAFAVSSSIGDSIESGVFDREQDGERALVHAAVRIQHCAALYAARHPARGYPASLDAMRAGLSGCVDRKTVRRSRLYTLEYQPAAPDADGRIASFTVRGRTDPRRTELLSVFGDTSGVLRRRRAMEAASDTTRPDDFIPQALSGIRDCLEQMRPSRGVPPSGAHLVSLVVAGRSKRGGGACDAWSAARVTNALDTANADYFAREFGYRVTYAAVGGGYRVAARPVAFGETGLRSYVMTDGGALHYTRLDRAATEADPQLAPCLPYLPGDCLPTPASAVPVAALLHDRLIPVEGVYKLRVRVPGAPTHIPTGLFWDFECDVRPPRDTATTWPWKRDFEMPAAWVHLADETCRNLASVKPLIGDTLVVRVWLRSAAGVTARIQDTILVDHGPASRVAGR